MDTESTTYRLANPVDIPIIVDLVNRDGEVRGWTSEADIVAGN